MNSSDLFVFLGGFWSGYALPASLLGLCLFGGLIAARGLKTGRSTTQILGAFFAVAGLHLADAQTALPLAAFVIALLVGLLAGLEWARVRPRERRRAPRPHA